jgi:urea transporter
MFRDGLALAASLLVGALAIGFAALVGHVLVDLAARAAQAWSGLF